jgi:hypothetical protein
MRTLRAGAAYFALVFAAGFVFGAIRVLGVAPKIGERSAELMEGPLMLIVIIFAARFVVALFVKSPRWTVRLGTGLIALGLMIAAEFAVLLWVRRLTFRSYLASRDPVAGTAYLFMLVVFTVMPLFVGRNSKGV